MPLHVPAPVTPAPASATSGRRLERYACATPRLTAAAPRTRPRHRASHTPNTAAPPCSIAHNNVELQGRRASLDR